MEGGFEALGVVIHHPLGLALDYLYLTVNRYVVEELIRGGPRVAIL